MMSLRRGFDFSFSHLTSSEILSDRSTRHGRDRHAGRYDHGNDVTLYDLSASDPLFPQFGRWSIPLHGSAFAMGFDACSRSVGPTAVVRESLHAMSIG